MRSPEPADPVEQRPNTEGPPKPDYPDLLVVDPAHYVITHEIARGGMGRIQVARDRRLGREVAVKEILASADSAVVARRFEREARITAQLQHPSIVSVHEAGTWPTGEPFYAMRLVHGRSFEEAIAAAETFEQRLALLPNVLAIADAMAYAHGKHVIHRDLKPKNVIVGEFGETVVIDWGLAKQLSQDDLVDSVPSATGGSGETTVGDVLGSPAYMPPEQAAGTAVDERADVYAIGAILYHVLAGQAPFVAASNAELIAAVYSTPPKPILEVAPSTPAELVAIIERAMARTGEARYPSARELAQDLRRFQTGQLVGAHRYSSRQLIRRWVARHRTAIAAGGTALIVALIISGFALHRIFAARELADDQRALASSNQQTAEQLMQFMLGDLLRKLERVGKLDLLDAVSRRAATYYDVRGEVGSDEDLHSSARARLGIANVMVSRANLPGALEEYEKSRRLLDLIVIKRPDVVEYQVDALMARNHIGEIHASQGDLASALASFQDAVNRAEQLYAAHPSDGRALHALLFSRSEIASGLEQRGDVAGALAEYQKVLATATSNVSAAQGQSGVKDLLNAHARVGRLLWSANSDLAGALREYRIALQLGEAELARDPKDVVWLQDVATSHGEVAQMLGEQKAYAGALMECRAGLAVLDRLIGVDPSNTQAQVSRRVLNERMGSILLAQHDAVNALAAFQTAYAISVELAAADPSNAESQRELSVIANKIGDVELANKDTAGALASFRVALAIREKLVAKDPDKQTWKRDLFYSHFKIAELFAGMSGMQSEAIAEYRAAIAIAEAAVARNPRSASAQDDLAGTRSNLGDALLTAHDREGARAQYREALILANKLAARPNPRPQWTKQAEELAAKLAKLDRSK